MTELIIDSFAGGGGASLGIEMALGRSPDYAINHDEKALAMHQANHPNTEHLSKNIWQIDPMDVVGRRPVGLLWASPDCKHFSKAKGGKPVKRNVRDLAWTVVLWAKRARPRVIILENVEEFRDWGPLTLDGKPCKDRKGQTFAKWVKELKRLGYKVEWRELRACDYGAPTIRKRLFVIARRDGQPIVWPEPTHGAPDSDGVKAGRLQPWRTAAEIIDWSLPCPSIFDSAEEIKALYGIRAKRPLADATLRRIARGVSKFVLNAKRPFIVVCNHGGDWFRGQSVDEPIATLTASRDAFGVVAPHITKFRSGATGHALNEPLATVTANGESKRPGGAVPLGIVAPVLTYGQQGGGNRPIDEPHHTVTASRKDTNAVIAPTLIQTGFGEREGQAPRAPGLDKPVGTQVAGASKHAVVAAFMAQHNAGPRPGQQAKAADAPMSTVTTTGAQQGVVAAHLSWMYTSNVRGGEGGLDRPAKTILAGGQHAALVAAFMDSYYGTDQAPAMDGPMPTDTTRDRRSLVTVDIDGETFVISDIGLRMLTPRERFRAQGFHDGYIIDRGVLPDGSTIPLTQEVQGRCCGNSVCPPLAQALVEANCADLANLMEAAE
jgi:DNA (cytosine-5)-methyltransferase 1